MKLTTEPKITAHTDAETADAGATPRSQEESDARWLEDSGMSADTPLEWTAARSAMTKPGHDHEHGNCHGAGGTTTPPRISDAPPGGENLQPLHWQTKWGEAPYVTMEATRQAYSRSIRSAAPTQLIMAGPSALEYLADGIAQLAAPCGP